ncbi:porin [Vibrio thalassae]|nr:porin [Vibrio thalassae]
MKKTLVALSVLAAAGSAQAIELYNQDKVTVNMVGDIEIVYKKAETKGSEFQQEIQDADFGFDTRYAINDDLQVGAFWEFKGSDTNNELGAQVGNVYMGLYSASVGDISFGKQATALDDAGIGSDYQFGIKSFFQNGTPFSGHEVVKYALDKGTFYGKVAYMQNKLGYNGIGKDGTYFDGKLGARVADFDFTGFYGQADIKAKQESTAWGTVTQDHLDNGMATGAVGDWAEITTPAEVGKKESIWALEARYAGVENLGLALGYYNVGVKPDGGSSANNTTIGAAADYSLDAWAFATGVSQTNPEVGDKVVNWYLNAGYSLAPSTTAYAEVGGNNGEGSQTGFAVGIKSSF